MRRACIAWGLVFLLLAQVLMGAAFLPLPFYYPLPPEVHAQAAILMDADTGQILYGKNELQQMEPASLTKVMTCLLVLEAGLDPHEPVRVTKEGLLGLTYDATTIGLSEGEVLTVEQLLYAMMLSSANDAANVLAVHVAGSRAEFTERMNQRARELGLAHTHFSNANGLPAPAHVTTAYDLALLTRTAYKQPMFTQYAGAAAYTIPAGGNNRGRRLTQLHRMLLPGWGNAYEGAIAGKTGWTTNAGHCLMTVASRDDTTLICIVLKEEGEEYQDTAALLSYGFEQFHRRWVDGSRFGTVTVTGMDAEGFERNWTFPLDDKKWPVLLPSGLEPENLSLSALALSAGSTQGEWTASLQWPDWVAGAPAWPVRSLVLVPDTPNTEDFKSMQWAFLAAVFLLWVYLLHGMLAPAQIEERRWRPYHRRSRFTRR